jgi:hypothetical protein
LETEYPPIKEIKMFTNRFFIVLVIVALAVVGALIVEETIATSAVTSNEQVADAARWQGMAEYYQKQAEVWSLERSQAAEDQPYSMDSATRSYIAWGEALAAAGKLGESDTCSNTTQGNIFARIPNNLDSATRSYIAWGLALQAKNDIRASCR